MSDETLPVTIQIMDKEYQIACPENEHDSLLTSAHYLNKKMKEIRDSGKVVGMDRIAVLAALNIAHELMQQENNRDSYSRNMGNRLQNLQTKIEMALSRSKQLEL